MFIERIVTNVTRSITSHLFRVMCSSLCPQMAGTFSIVVCTVAAATADSWYKTSTPEENHNLCLDAPSGNAFNGNMLWLWECNGMNAQIWVFDNYQIRYGGDENFCIDAHDMADGEQLMLWECHGME